MASKTDETPQGEEVLEKPLETPSDIPPLDLSDPAVGNLIRSAKKRGYVTHDQINSVLSSEELNSEQMEDVLAAFSEMGVNVVEIEEASDDGEEQDEEADEQGEGESGRLVVWQKVLGKSEAQPSQRAGDPVGMYLREMSSMQPLSREGEIAVAKRIEAGHEAMIAGLCESPLTFQAILVWRDELKEGKVFLSDIIDLEATYFGPGAKAMPGRSDGQLFADAQKQLPASAASATAFAPALERTDGEVSEGGEPAPDQANDDDMENLLSQAAIEAEVKPKVLETFDNIADAYKRLHRLQDQVIHNSFRNDCLSLAQVRRHKKLKSDIVAEVKSLRLNQVRVDALMEQLYGINKRLVGYEGRLMRLARSHGITREDFLKNYQGSEFDPLCSTGYQSSQPRAGAFLAKKKKKSNTTARTSRRSPARSDSRSAIFVRSSTWCKRVSVRRVRQRRKWWKRTCGS
jgi:RNA polymerase primary sigma factor